MIAMKQAIAGVAPPESGEVTTMIVWPSIAGTEMGRRWGRLYMIRTGIGNILTVGKLIALASIPIALGLFAMNFSPGFMRRYRLTNRRRGRDRIPWHCRRWVLLDQFDTIELVVLPGQEWYRAGDLVFRNGRIETMRLNAVPQPETFRQTCLKAQRSFTGVQRAASNSRPSASCEPQAEGGSLLFAATISRLNGGRVLGHGAQASPIVPQCDNEFGSS